MAEQSSGGLGLPKFQHNERQQKWVASERRTAALIQLLWKVAGQKQRNDPAFLCLLVQCGWNTGGRKNEGDSTRRWRNRKIAEYLKVRHVSDQQLAHDLHSQFKFLSTSKCLSILRQRTGITLYYRPYYPATLRFVRQHSGDIALAFRQVSTNSADVHAKVRRVASLIESLGKFQAAGQFVSPFKGLTPVLSCLDLQRRFPIMNKRTHALLESIERKADKEGIVALSKLIGPTYDIRDARELDVYASSERFPKPKAHSRAADSARDSFKNIGLKSEINSLGQIATKKTTIKKLHNKLINRLNEYLLWRHVTAKESKFDALVIGWKKGRDLLIEAKTESDGTTGRAQIRQAIGQLYDYRFTFMPKNNVDLAVLLPREPTADVKSLLDSLDIELLWFKRNELKGTIHL
jgi:hypothetical protein